MRLSGLSVTAKGARRGSVLDLEVVAQAREKLKAASGMKPAPLGVSVVPPTLSLRLSKALEKVLNNRKGAD